MSSSLLAGKVALVSGGARGMGASHCRALVQHGGSVVIADVLDDAGRALAEELGTSALFVHLDVTSTSHWSDAIAATSERFGRLDVLINNAGIISTSPLEGYSDEEWEQVLSVNLTGQFKGIRAAVALLRASAPSSVINISSTAGLKGFGSGAAYVSSKFGVRGLTKAAAVELASSGIRVNSVHPGNIETTMTEGLDFRGFPGVPMRRAGSVDEVTELVIFLASDRSSFSTGAEFVVDGGETAGQPMS